jgi:nitrate/TMAO reductase-like tetraheme cytochrome c subunit
MEQPNNQRGDATRSVLVLLTSHWISMTGVALVTLAGFSWIFVLPTNLRGHAENPYIGLLIFVAIPIVFFAGLILIPIGIALGKRRIASQLAALPDRRTAFRRAGIFFAVMTGANVIIGSQVSYKAVEHMDTVQFCGQSCHVMKPEYTAHLRAPHQQVACASCHIAPGTSGWLKGKMSGTRQLMEVIFNSYPRPIESALASDRLVSSTETCEQCHARQKYIGPRLRVTTKFAPDESNSRTETVLTMLVGGGDRGGIHGAHMGPGVHIRYAAMDKKRQAIPWVEYRNSASGAVRTYATADSKDGTSLPTFEMQCADCHNRAAHRFEDPDAAVDQALAGGQIDASLPFIKKTGAELIKAAYQTDADAEQKIPAGLVAFYRQSNPDVASKRASEIQAAGAALLAIYQSNVFPDLKVTWGTYLNNLGHIDTPGCFRCHDGGHSTTTGQAITQDCDTCHKVVAVDEVSPEVLKTIGIAR